MLIRCYWRNCRYSGKRWDNSPVDAVWVEATEQEAEDAVFPHLDQESIAESKELAERYRGVAEKIENPARPFCFLVARDLRSIEPFHPHYPFHQLWNGDSPFEPMPETTVASLNEVRDVKLPD